MQVTYRNVNEAFTNLVVAFKDGRLQGKGNSNHVPIRKSPSRVGDVLLIDEPVTILYERPLERVLFNRERDANPFFHLYEALWMLDGRRDIAPLDYYSSGYSKQVQDGDSPYANGAYGYRWRCSGANLGEDANWTIVDQLAVLIAHLKAKPESRRAVLQMWTVEDDLLKIDSSKDVCCNTCCYFSIRAEKRMHDWTPEKLQRRIDQEYEMSGLARRDGDDKDAAKRLDLIKEYRAGYDGTYNGYLDMTVCNRSNDLIWGALGANVVHFSVLQEYLAAHLRVGVGRYYQFTNNLHVYTERFEPEKWLKDANYGSPYPSPTFPLVSDPAKFDEEVVEFVQRHRQDAFANEGYQEPFLRDVAQPMMIAFHKHKQRDYPAAFRAMNSVLATDWRAAGWSWLQKRCNAYSAKQSERTNA